MDVQALETSRRKLRDIAAADRRGVHRPELVVAARKEVEALTQSLAAASDSQKAAIRDLIGRYERLIDGLL